MVLVVPGTLPPWFVFAAQVLHYQRLMVIVFAVEYATEMVIFLMSAVSMSTLVTNLVAVALVTTIFVMSAVLMSKHIGNTESDL